MPSRSNPSKQFVARCICAPAPLWWAAPRFHAIPFDPPEFHDMLGVPSDSPTAAGLLAVMQ
eukprot:1397839-Pyramimonas_sp.AAC.1